MKSIYPQVIARQTILSWTKHREALITFVGKEVHLMNFSWGLNRELGPIVSESDAKDGLTAFITKPDVEKKNVQRVILKALVHQ